MGGEDNTSYPLDEARVLGGEEEEGGGVHVGHVPQHAARHLLLFRLKILWEEQKQQVLKEEIARGEA